MTVDEKRAARTRHAAAALAAAILATMAVAYSLTYEPAPAVDVRWRENLTPEERQRLERRFGLVEPSHPERRSSTYDLLDTSASNIRDLLTHPDVEDTNRFQRETFTVRPDVPYGESWMWVGDRLPLLRIRPVAWGIVAACVIAIAVYGFGALASRPRT